MAQLKTKSWIWKHIKLKGRKAAYLFLTIKKNITSWTIESILGFFSAFLWKDLKGFHHETLWKFQDISMLIDSDLPIFGGGNSRRPCISLRLRDSRSPPINILTGLDYWLDNLMSNVPEVAMCYHINGFVQVKAKDCPWVKGQLIFFWFLN